MKRMVALLVTMVFVALVSGSGYLALQGSGGDQGSFMPGGIALARPAIAQEASFLDTEAGMSAYTNTGLTINLNNARNAFRTVERQTADWLIGSVPVPGYGEDQDAHVFVHRTGWIVAYYERGSPVARTVHWTGHPTLGVHKLQQVLTQVGGSAGVPIPSVGFFNFEFPNATEWLLIVDNDSFSLNIPSQFLMFERSFSHLVTGAGCNLYSCWGSALTIDGGSIHNSGGSNGTFYGQISAITLGTDASHSVAVSGAAPGSAAISLLYLPPQ